MVNFDESVHVIADKYCGDIVEIEQLRVLKIRIFRSPHTIGHFCEMPDITTHVDHYYDTDDFSLGQEGKYVRVRQVGDSQRIVSRMESNVSCSAHIIKQTNLSLSEFPSNMKPFITLKFTRRRLSLRGFDVPNNKVVIVHDAMSEPTTYEIISIGIDITDTDSNIQYLREAPFLPVNTKLMYMLQISEAHLYTSYFRKWNCAEERISTEVSALFGKAQGELNCQKEYIWLSEAPATFSGALQSCGGDKTKAFELFNAVRADTMEDDCMYVCQADQTEVF